MTRLDEVALSIEITLISLVEGFALQFLAGSATPIVHDHTQAVFILYVIAAVLFTLIFWSQAVAHAVSFIRWPIRIGHMFLYFVAAFVQVISFGNITDPVRWFFWCGIFTIIIALLYWLDLDLIHKSRRKFENMPKGPAFLAQVERRHRYELHTLVPAALIFNIGIFFLLFLYPSYFGMGWYAIFGILQMVVSIGALVDCVRNFRLRAKMVGQLWEDND